MRIEPVRWARQRIIDTQAMLAEELRDVELRLGPEGVRAYLDHAIEALATNPDPEAQLRRFCFVMTLLVQHERHGWLSPAEVTRVADLAEAILKIQGINPQSSKLSWLYGDLHLVLSQIRRKEGRPWHAAWLAQTAVSVGFGGPRDEAHGALTTAGRALRLGNLTLALEATTLAADAPKAQLMRLQALRLAGRLDEADELAAKLTATDDETRLELEWEAMCRHAQRTGDLTTMVNAVARGRSHRHPTYMLEVTLWAKVVPSKQWLDRVPRVETIRKLFPDAFRRGSHNAFFYECAAKMDRSYDNGIPLPHRLTDLGALLEDTGRLLTFDKELLLFAAATRFLGRYHQPVLAALAQGEYRARSLRASDGVTADVFGIANVAASGAKPGEHPVASATGRAASMTRMAAAVGGTMLKGKLKRLASPASEAPRLKAEETAEISRIIVDVLGKMRGPTAKLGQLISMASGRLPEDIRTSLSALRDSLPPIATEDIRQVVLEEFGKPVEELFAYWSEEPIAAASIGQLHAATLHDGREVVVKVQYPGIRSTIDADAKLAKLIRPRLLKLFPSANVDEVAQLSHDQLAAECEYRKEAANQMAMAEFFKNDPDIVIPTVHMAFTTDRVITMDYVRGQKIKDFVESSTQEERDRAGRIIYRFGWESVLKHGFFNGDPHPGNFLFLEDGRVACLDFGYATVMSKERRALWNKLLRVFAEDDYPSFPMSFRALGYVVDGMPFDDASAWEVGKSTMSALRSKVPCRFDQRDIGRNIENATVGFANRSALRLPLEDAMFLRFSWCLQAALGELGAEVHWFRVMEPILYGDDSRRFKVSS